MIVSVKRKHIKRGKPGSCFFCPVALALKDVGCITPSVGPSLNYRVSMGGSVVSHPSPRSVRRFYTRFDAGRSVKPFRFILK